MTDPYSALVAVRQDLPPPYVVESPVGASAEPDLPSLSRIVLQPIVAVPVAALRPADSPRFGAPDADHARILADVEEDLPPILVRRATMRVIDGMHRLLAAELRGDNTINVRFFEGGEGEAFLLAVRANIAHGLPLKIAERRAAANRIVQARPEMSDRSIAGVVGLAAKTVAGIRRSATGDVPHLDARVGRDGRVRPLSSAEGRRLAGELLAKHPDSSLRTIARGAGISVGTARDVRERLRRGENPAPPRQHRRAESAEADRTDRASAGSPRRTVEVVDHSSTLETLRRDPSLVYSAAGRSLLRWLGVRLVGKADWEQILPSIPPHCAIVVARMARGSAMAWTDFAEALERHAESCA
jgi:ParB-like chromosome segregation protein Spo0J